MKKLWRYVDEHVNPVFLKELRQLLRTKTLLWVLGLYPFFLFVFALSIVGLNHLNQPSLYQFYDLALGKTLLRIVCSFLVVVGCLVLPISMASRTAREVGTGRGDLMFITTLTPSQVVWGKLKANLFLQGVFIALSFPFLTLSYLLRGVGMSSILFWPVWITIISLLASSVVLMTSVNRYSTGLKNLTFVVEAVALCWFGILYVASSPNLLNLVTALSYSMIASILFILIFQAATASALMPPHSDSHFRLRITEVFVFVGTFAAETIYFRCWSSPNHVEDMECLFNTGAIVALLIGARAALLTLPLSRVVCAGAPRSLIKRMLKFPFITCGESGVLFSLLLMAMMSGCALVVGMNNLYTGWALYTELLFLPIVCKILADAAGFSDKTRRALLASYVGGIIVWQILANAKSKTCFLWNIYTMFRDPEQHVEFANIFGWIIVVYLLIGSVFAFRRYRQTKKSN